MGKTPDSSGTSGRPTGLRTGRFEAFSDAVFAIAGTLLVLDLAIPVTSSSARHLLDAFGHEWPGYLGYVVSFATIGAVWLGHNAISDYLDRTDSTLLRLNLLLLLVVAFLPYPTRLMASYVNKGDAERVASTIYGLTLLAAAALLYLLWRYALHAKLIRPDTSDDEVTLLSQRLTPGLAGYAVLIIIGIFVPILAVVGYFLIALFFLLPVRRSLSQPGQS
jgi:uncharacterized membrane protein